MLKRGNIQQAKRIEEALSELETKLAHYQHVDRFSISSGCMLELQDYPDPSRLGECFRMVQLAIVQMLEGQIREAKRELENLGVSV